MTLVTAILLAFGISACAGQEELVILTSSGYEPYEMIDENGELSGFDIDLMNAIAEYL